jgi:acetyl-CoA synthetase
MIKKKKKNPKKPSVRKVKSKKKVSKKPSVRKVKSKKKVSKKPSVRKVKSKKKVLKEVEEKEIIFKTKPELLKSDLVNKAKYQKKYIDSIKNNNEFWKKEGKRITWIKPYKKIKNVKYSKDDVKIRWYEDGTLNASANCVDRHLKEKKDKSKT